ncbi:intracellular protein transport protein USO1 [Reticulomyxa filosa]|uniref:Intracellular protein transport protein USO1 n=1 Tax=Reticulomyxa filosa TaxID=46433 RepID=X6N4I4_RETFI|nr:intracellular protein transport protein USO1 [Reticulomyxa filosa]|eukprot:ETO21205.1 intracellular protein transport protein USO1 [Reticulomyxa filosa]
MSLMEYLVIILNKNDKSALKFVDDFEILGEASRVDVSQLTVDVGKIGSNLHAIKKRIDSKVDQTDRRNLFSDVMSHFLKSSETEYHQLKSRYEKVKSDCVKLAEFLNQGNDIQMEFFKLLNEFRLLFIKAQEAVTQKEKDEEKQRNKERKGQNKPGKKKKTKSKLQSKKSDQDELGGILHKRKGKTAVATILQAADEREKQEMKNKTAEKQVEAVPDTPVKKPLLEVLDEKTEASSMTDGVNILYLCCYFFFSSLSYCF